MYKYTMMYQSNTTKLRLAYLGITFFLTRHCLLLL